jgi:hypothetical protein
LSNRFPFKYRKAFLHKFIDAFGDELKEVQEEAAAADAQLSADLESLIPLQK